MKLTDLYNNEKRAPFHYSIPEPRELEHMGFPPLKPVPQMIFWYLYHRARGWKFQCSNNELAMVTNQSQRTVRSAIQKLAMLKLVSRNRLWFTILWRPILPPRPAESAGAKRPDGGQMLGRQNLPPSRVMVAKSATQPGKICHHPRTLEPKDSSSKQPSLSKRRSPETGARTREAEGAGPAPAAAFLKEAAFSGSATDFAVPVSSLLDDAVNSIVSGRRVATENEKARRANAGPNYRFPPSTDRKTHDTKRHSA